MFMSIEIDCGGLAQNGESFEKIDFGDYFYSSGTPYADDPNALSPNERPAGARCPRRLGIDTEAHP